MSNILMTIKSKMFLTFLTIGDTANKLGIEKKDASGIGNTILPVIKNVFYVVAVLVAVAALCFVGVKLISAKRSDDRQEVMARVPYIVLGLLIVSAASGLIGWICGLFV